MRRSRDRAPQRAAEAVGGLRYVEQPCASIEELARVRRAVRPPPSPPMSPFAALGITSGLVARRGRRSRSSRSLRSAGSQGFENRRGSKGLRLVVSSRPQIDRPSGRGPALHIDPRGGPRLRAPRPPSLPRLRCRRRARAHQRPEAYPFASSSPTSASGLARRRLPQRPLDQSSRRRWPCTSGSADGVILPNCSPRSLLLMPVSAGVRDVFTCPVRTRRSPMRWQPRSTQASSAPMSASMSVRPASCAIGLSRAGRRDDSSCDDPALRRRPAPVAIVTTSGAVAELRGSRRGHHSRLPLIVVVLDPAAEMQG